MALDQTLGVSNPLCPGNGVFENWVGCQVYHQNSGFFPFLPSPFPPPLLRGLSNNVEEWWKTRKCSVCLEIRF